MRPRVPLSAKILLWFFANLLIIAVAAYAFIEFQFHLGPESLLGGRAGKRVDALAELVTGEMNQAGPSELEAMRASTEPSQWDGILARAGNLYGLRLLVATPDGRQIAGEKIALPQQVIGALYPPLPRPHGGPPPPPPAGAMDQPPPADGPGPQPPGGPNFPHPHRMIHTEHPSRYWLLVPMDLYPPHPPLTLIAVSDSIGLGGLVVDFTPWIAAAAGILIFSVLFWLPLVRGITRSIREMTAATARVAEGRFDMRVREDRGDELGLLAQSINGMAERLSGFVNGQKRFLGDIAHELCSPLARAQVALGILESKVDPAQFDDLREEIQQISSLVNELLSFSKASLAAGRIKLESIPLHEVMARAIEREGLAPPAIQVAIRDDLVVKADPDLLCRALSNVLRNAVKYAGGAGAIEVTAEQPGADVILTISDHGPGVPEDALGQIFDPFYRVDVSRARETGGTGLGLSIVKTCVESCGGRVSCQNRRPHGLGVVIALAAG